MKRLLLVVSVLVVVVTASGVGGQTASSATTAAADARQPSVKAMAARRERDATREAESLLHAFALPPGARPTREPANYGGVLRRSGPEPPAKVVDVHRFWSVQKPLKVVAAFVRAHRVRGLKTTGATYGSNVPHYLTWSFVRPTSSHRVPSSRLLNVTAVRLPGRTILRVDAKAAWIYPRSPNEQVPAKVREIVLRTPKVHLKVTDRAQVERVAKLLGRRELVDGSGELEEVGVTGAHDAPAAGRGLQPTAIARGIPIQMIAPTKNPAVAQLK